MTCDATALAARDSLSADSGGQPGDPRVRTRPSRRGIVLGVFVGLLAGALVGAVAMGLAFPRPDTSAIVVAQSPMRVTAVVSLQPTRAIYTLAGHVVAPTEEPIALTDTSPSGANVVTARTHPVGEPLHNLDLVAEVSNRPVFGLLGSVPLYRDLAPDVAGSDVTAIQVALIAAGYLKGKPSGRMDPSTSNAIRTWFKAAGYIAPDLESVLPPEPDPVTGLVPPPPSRPGLPLADVVAIPADGLVVTAVAPIGQRLDADHPLVTLRTRQAFITARADLLAASSFGAGTPVLVQVGSGQPVPSTVLSVSGFEPGGEGVSPGYDVNLAMPEGVVAADSLDLPVRVIETVVPAEEPAVPLTAIRTDSLGAFVFRAAVDGTQPDTRVAVDVRGQANGYATIGAVPALPVGTAVVLMGERV